MTPPSVGERQTRARGEARDHPSEPAGVTSAPPAAPRLPSAVERVLEHLWQSGHAAYVVGGALRDAVLGRPAADWDIATDARPEQLLVLFPGSHYENRFGTVTVDEVEVTTFRRDHEYADHRRPDAVTFTDDVDEDLVRRDFTVNAMAWGRGGAARGAAEWRDPTGGLPDISRRLVRAVGDPDRRFDEDALRLLRAARFAAQLGFDIEPQTLAAMARHADLARHVSRERVGQELRRMLLAPVPSAGLRLLADTGVLQPVLPDLVAQRGVPQNKIPGHDLWDHTLLTLDAMAGIRPGDATLLLAALLHDVGKPQTWSEGHFPHHDEVGARLADAILGHLAIPRVETERVVRLIRAHMFGYEPSWGDAAVRRFIRRVGPDLVDDLCHLREADNIGSGVPPDAGWLGELRARVARELADGNPLSLSDLAVDGNDLQAATARGPGPWIGEWLDRLLESVIGDPSRNTRERLLADVRNWLGQRSDAPGAHDAIEEAP